MVHHTVSIPLLSLAGLAAMVGAALWTVRVPRTPIAVPRGDGTYLPLGAPGAPPTRWYANLLPSSGLPFVGEVGILELADGQLSFTGKGADEPAWRFSAREIRAQHHTRLIHPATVDLWLPTGVLLLEVSRSPIHSWIRSNLASMRRPAEAHIFLQILGANGALVSAGPRWPVVPGERMLQ